MAPSGLSREVILARLKVYEECGCVYRHAARALRINDSSIRSTIDRARALGIPIPTKPAVQPAFVSPEPTSEPTSPAKPIASPVVLQRLRDEVQRLKAELREVHRNDVSTEDVRKYILGLSECDQDPPDWVLKPVKTKHGWRTAVSTILSDLHISEKVSLSETNGINEYNIEIFKRRIQRYASTFLRLCFTHTVNPDFAGVVVNLIGDLVSGGIHAELRETNELTSMQTVLFAEETIIWVLDQLLKRFSHVLVVGVPGNHGRETIKPQAKRYVFQNFDWLICQMIRRHYERRGEERIRFLIPDSGNALYRVYGWRYYAIHGDDLGVKGGDGIIGSLGPIARGEIKIHHSSALIGRDYDFLLMGHHHQQFWLPRVIVNNTMKGHCEFAWRMLKAPPSTPSQSMWETHPDHGIICRRDVFCDDQIPRQKVEEWRSVFEM
jgi:hypothetical protein